MLSPTEPVMIVLKLSFIVGPGPRVTHHHLPDLGVPLPGALRQGAQGGRARAVRGAAAVPDRRGAGLRVHHSPGAAGALQLPERSAGAVHHLRQLFRVRAPDRSGAGDFVRVTAGDHRAGRDRHHHPGRARAIPAVRHRAGLRRRRDSVARHGYHLDDHDDDPAALSLRDRVCRHRGHLPPPPAGRSPRGPGEQRDRPDDDDPALPDGGGGGRRPGAGAPEEVPPARAGYRRDPAGHRRSLGAIPGRSRRRSIPPWPGGWACPPRRPGSFPIRTR